MDFPLIMQLERHVEATFFGVLTGVCENVYQSRQTNINASPRVTIKAITGEVFQRQKLPISIPPGWIYSAYEGQVQITVVTNRTTEAKSDAHYTLIGEVRERCQQYNMNAWQNATPEGTLPVLVFDIREGGTSDEIQDTEDLDLTQISFNILFSINPAVLPTNL